MFQIVLTTEGRMPLTDNERLARTLVRAIAMTLGSDLLLFSVVDEHAHLVVDGPEPTIRVRAAALAKTVHARAGSAVQAPHVSAVNGRRHLDTLVGYFLRQTVKHGLSGHPAAWTGSCLPDLVGVRATARFSSDPLRQALPRLTLESILRRVELDLSAVREADDDSVFDAGPRAVVEAAAAALCVMPDEASDRAVLARRAAIHLLSAVDYRPPALARAVGMTERGVRRLSAQPVPGEALGLVRRRVRFEAAVAAAPPVTPNEREKAALQRSPFR